MQRLRESPAVRWIAVLVFTTSTSACASWETIQDRDLPDRIRVIKTTPDTVELNLPRFEGDSIVVGLEANATRRIPTDSILRLEAKRESTVLPAIFVTAIFVALVAMLCAADDEDFFC